MAPSYRILQGVRVLFQLLVFNRFFFDLVCELTDRESGVDSAAIFFQSVINKLVLVLKICLDINLVINKLVNLYWTKREILRVGQKKDLFRKASLFRKSWEDFVDLSIVIQGRTVGGGLLIT